MEVVKEQTKVLVPGIKVKKKMAYVDQQLTYIFSLDVQILNNIDFEIDFTGSQNISLKNMPTQARIAFKTVEPREVTQVAQVELHEGWKLVTKFKFRKIPIAKEKQTQYIRGLIETRNSEKKLVQTVLKGIDIAMTPLEQVSEVLLKNGVKFIDEDFPPEESSIVGRSDKNLIDDTVNHWRRPEEFFGGVSYELIHRINPNSLIRGKLSDRAFFSVLVCLALAHPGLLEKLFLGQTEINPSGIYKLKLCKNGEWQTVIVDDLVPCEPLGNPKFIHSQKPEIWMHLLQKAYAKLHHRYLSLHQLEVGHVFNDITGCPTHLEELDPEARNFKKKLTEHLTKKNMVCLFQVEEREFDEDEFVALKDYAYLLLKAEEQEDKTYFTLLGHSLEKLELSQDEILSKFSYACICHVRSWEEVRIKGKFVTVEAGQKEGEMPVSMSKWFYSLELPQPAQVHLCLHQEDVLVGDNQQFKDYAYCSLLLLEKGEKSLLRPKVLKNFSHNRQIQFWVSLDAGIYLVVPFINSEASIKRPRQEQDLVEDVFRKLDLLMRRELKYPELVSFFRVCDQVFDQDIFYEMLKKHAYNKKGLSLHAFRRLWAANRIYWKDTLDYYLKQRLFTFSIHSDSELNVLVKNNIGTQLNNKAHCQLISQLGREVKLDKKYEKYVKVKYLRSKSQIMEYMVQNRHQRKLEVELDCSESVGYHFFPTSGKVSVLLDSGQKEFLMKLVPFERIENKDLQNHQKFRIKNLD